jgi:hypothetical protein
MKIVTKEINGVWYNFPEKWYKDLFYGLVLIKKDSGCLVVNPKDNAEYYFEDKNIEELVSKVQNYDESFLTDLIHKGFSIKQNIFA